jgi:predicted DNA-binding protein (MmcQ/YjbR family)
VAFDLAAEVINFEVLQQEPGIRPAPYLASRGMKGLQVYEAGAMSDLTLKEHIVMSYDLVVAGMSKKKRGELGLG